VSLLEKIAFEIREHGPIPFSRYMELCLYEAEAGFYSRNLERFGKAGDFYTSSDIHALFGRLLARQFEEMWRVLGQPGRIEVLELGPGRGLFARDVLDWSGKKFPAFYEALHYSLTERSEALQRKLATNLSRQLEAGKASLLPVPPGSGLLERALPRDTPIILFANEFFDALPFEILGEKGKLFVDFRDGELVECWKQPTQHELELLDQYGVAPEPGERLEVSPIAQQFMLEIGNTIEHGLALVIDYGYTREEQLARRHRGTLMTFRQHAASASPYEAPGEQDITAHVNFTALSKAAERGAMQVQPLITQSQFLLGIGETNQFADAFEECAVPQERAKVALQLKHLITPAGMGESFQVMLASKGVNPAAVANLSGLSFGRERLML